MDDRNKKAFDAASEVTKQLITLATAIIGGFVTFAKSAADSAMDFRSWGPCLTWSFAMLGLSILCGLFALMQITGQLGNLKVGTPSTYSAAIRWFVGAQIILFGLGTMLFVFVVPQWKWH